MTNFVRGEWRDLYLFRPEVYDVFSVAEDSENAIVEHIGHRCSLDGATALDLGAGTGRFSAEFARRGTNVIAVEPCLEMAKILNERIRSLEEVPTSGTIRHVRAYAEDLDLPDESIDFAFVSWVLSELNARDSDSCSSQDDGARRVAMAIGQLRRVLRPGGVLWVVETAPGSYFGDMQKKLTGEGGDLSNGFTDELIRQFGFQCAEIDVLVTFLSAEDAIRVCRIIFGHRAGDLIAHANCQFSMRVRLLNLSK